MSIGELSALNTYRFRGFQITKRHSLTAVMIFMIVGKGSFVAITFGKGYLVLHLVSNL